MTARAPIGSLRHRLARLQTALPNATAAAAAVAPPIPPPASSSDGRTWRTRLTTLAFRLYGFLAARRRKLLPLTTRAAGLLDRYLINASAGATVLRFANQLAQRSRGRLSTRLVLATLAASAQVHLAASRKPSALRAVRLINLIFRAEVRARRGLAPSAYFTTLALCSAYDRIVREVPAPETIDAFAINFAVGVAHMYRGNHAVAEHFLKAAARAGDGNALRKLGSVYALMGDHARAADCFQASVARDPRSVMAHQNYAGGYDPSTYTPSAWELEHAGELLIYDNLIQLGENFYHQGRHDDTFRCYQAALDHQDALARKWSIPDPLVQRIAAQAGDDGGNFNPELPVRLLGYEWVTLIGHIGFIDCHLRMAELSMLPRANYVLLAPRAKVVNAAFLGLFARHLTIIEDAALVDDLLPYQRLVGDQFIAVRGTGGLAEGLAEPWAHAASRAQVAWAAEKRGPIVAIPDELRERGQKRLRDAGVTADWFVAMHIREGGYHGDGPGTTRQHRSANVADYREAIAHITARGGAVVRLGDSSMTPLNGVPGVFDYAHSDSKSAEMDLYLCAEARLFIGTTSGLTTAVQALGTPMLLVNCTSNDCQFWHEKTDFTLRPVYDRRARRYLSLRETYQQPLQSLLIDGAVLARHGLEIHANRPEDITAAARYTLDCLDGKVTHLQAGGELLDRYRTALSGNPFNFGAALPVPAFLARLPELLS
jgi:putative glycosyltransferase (TIGR04372 family)